MGLYRGLFSGVSGLDGQSNKIGNLSGNIANVNTVGYKRSVGGFESLVTGTGGAGSGVIGTTRQLVDQQGLLQSTSSATDIAVSGSGFFVVNTEFDGTGSVLYTRAGDFRSDSLGNFVNSAGFYLQGWPLDRDGRLPGEPGNTTNTTSSANLTSLETVNINTVSGLAAATTTVEIGANLNADQSIFLGSGVTAATDANDLSNYGSSGSLPSKSILVPTGVNDLTVGDVINVTTSSGVNTDFTYGGFSFSRIITSGLSADDGSGALGTGVDATVAIADAALPDPSITTGAMNSGVITVTTTGAHGLIAGDAITLSGLAVVDGIDPNGTFIVISAPTATTFTIDTGGMATAGGQTGGGAAGMFRPEVVTTTSGDATVSIRQDAHGYSSGDVIEFNNLSAVGGFSAADFNTAGNRFVVTVVDADHYTIEMLTTATSSAGGGGTTAEVDSRIFTGQILNASLATDRFLGTEPTASFTNTALTFSISTSNTSYTFTYTSGTPNVTLGQFNTLNNLAQAINTKTDLSARVVNNQLFVGGVDANDLLTFANGSTTGVEGPPVQAGIDWIGELGLQSISAVVGGRFNSLQSLSDGVDEIDGLSSSVTNPTGAASISINASDPLASITVSDDAGNTGSVLAALGIATSFNGGAVTPQSVSLTGSYDPTDITKNMASGAIQPQFSRPIQIFDSLGAPRNLTVGFLKTGVNTWAAEVYVAPASDVTSTNGDGLIAFGDIAFNGDGTLASVSTALTSALSITWNPSNNGATPSAITIDWGTAGAIGTGQADGLAQFVSSYAVSFVNQNGAPVGQLDRISISEDGTVTATFTNGDTQALYRIPLAQFTDPNKLAALSAGVYSETQDSGTVNLQVSGVGGSGDIVSLALEASNVDLASELTDLIIAQRAYQANTKIISTVDDLLEQLNQTVR